MWEGLSLGRHLLAVMGQGFSSVGDAEGGQQVGVRNWVRVYDNMSGQGQSRGNRLGEAPLMSVLCWAGLSGEGQRRAESTG